MFYGIKYPYTYVHITVFLLDFNTLQVFTDKGRIVTKVISYITLNYHSTCKTIRCQYG